MAPEKISPTEQLTFELKELVELKASRLSDDDRLEIVKFSVDQSIAALNAQVETLQSIRQRATNIIAINGAILLLARTIIPNTAINPLQSGQAMIEWVVVRLFFSGAVLMFTIAIVLSLLVLATRAGWQFTTSGKKFTDKYLESSKYRSLESVFRDFLEIAEESHRSNNQKLVRLHWFLLLSIASTVLHAVFWLLDGIGG